MGCIGQKMSLTFPTSMLHYIYKHSPNNKRQQQMIWLLNHDTDTITKMTITEFMEKFNNGDIPDELYTIKTVQYDHPHSTK